MDATYVETVRLLLEVAPHVFRSRRFALKGGTAINLFVRDMPRLSIDIDVVYTDHKALREDALREIASELNTLQEQLGIVGIEADCFQTNTGSEVKLIARRGKAMVKVEVNFVFRGALLPVGDRQLAKAARDLFTTDLVIPVLSEAELYGSKLVAALDRQHPRDFFDVLGMYQESGLTPDIVECFVGYLAGHNRPIHEVLFSRDQDMGAAFENEFEGMTITPVTIEELNSVRARLREDLATALSENHRNFLLSIARCEPKWDLASCPHLAELPALRWKIGNLEILRKKNPAKFGLQSEELQKRFGA